MSSDKDKVLPEVVSGMFRNAYVGGLTKREYFAGLAMQGWFANSSAQAVASDVEVTAVLAVSMADALLAELAKPQVATPTAPEAPEKFMQEASKARVDTGHSTALNSAAKQLLKGHCCYGQYARGSCDCEEPK